MKRLANILNKKLIIPLTLGFFSIYSCDSPLNKIENNYTEGKIINGSVILKEDSIDDDLNKEFARCGILQKDSIIELVLIYKNSGIDSLINLEDTLELKNPYVLKKQSNTAITISKYGFYDKIKINSEEFYRE